MLQDEEVSYVAQLRLQARERPDELVYWHIGRDGGEPGFTWSWIDRRSSQVARALGERGVGFADRVGIGLHNSPGFVLSVFATWKLGTVPVPVRWDLPDWELSRLLDVIEPRLYLSEDDAGWLRATETVDAPPTEIAVSPHLQGICSSGSTGTPKVILSGSPAVFTPSYVVPLAEMWGPVRGRRRSWCWRRCTTSTRSSPRSPAGGRSGRGHGEVRRGPRAGRGGATPGVHVHGHPDHVAAHGRRAGRGAQGSLEPGVDHPGGGADATVTGAPVGAFIGYERLVMAYGMTEGLGITVVRGDEWLAHEGTVGRGWQETEVRILGADGADCPTGEIGDIYLRTPRPGYQYLGDAPRLPCTDDGFVSGGDMGYLDEDGYLYLVDRRVDLIISGGANVFPAEVEAALIDHPEVVDVVVIGLKDPQWGRRVHAVIEVRDPAAPPTVEEVIAFAKGRLAPYKVPKTVEIVDAIPAARRPRSTGAAWWRHGEAE